MALGGMGAQPSNALQPYKPPSGGSVFQGGKGPQPPQNVPRSTRIGGIFGGQAQRAQQAQQAIQTQQAAQKRAQAQAEQVRFQQQQPVYAQPPVMGSGLSAVKQPLAQQQALFDKNMAQAAALPAAQLANFAQQFQQAAARGDPSTVRPGTVMGKPGDLVRVGMKKGGMVSSKPKASSASSRGDGFATKGKTKGRFV